MSDIDYEYERKHRLENNLKIVEEIRKFLYAYPDMRFIQALWALGIITRDKDFNIEDKFYEEPGQTLERVQANVDSRC